MKNLIKKILKESDDLEWIRDIINDDTVTRHNVHVGMRVRMNPNSKFKRQAKENEHGTVSHINDDDFPGQYETYWVYVKWDEGRLNSYRVGDDEYDLLFSTKKPPIKESDGLEWIKNIEPTKIENHTKYKVKYEDFYDFLAQVEEEQPTFRWLSAIKPTEFKVPYKYAKTPPEYIKIVIRNGWLTYNMGGQQLVGQQAIDFSDTLDWPYTIE